MSYVILQTDKDSTTPDDVRGPYDTRQDAAEDLHYLIDAELHLRKGVTYQLGWVEVEK